MFIQLKKSFQGQLPGARIDVAEADAKTLLDAGVAEAVQGDPLAPLLQKSMEGMLSNLTDSLNKSIDAALKQFASAQGKSRKNAIPAIFGESGEGDPKKTFGNFLLAVRNRDAKALEEMGAKFCDWDTAEKKTAMSTQTGTNGGYLVPTEFYSKLMALVTENSIVRQRATIIPMGARSVQVPALDVTTAQSGRHRLLGWRRGPLDRGSNDDERNRAESQADRAHQLRTQRLHEGEQHAARRRRDRPGSVPLPNLRPSDRLVRGLRLPSWQWRRQAARRRLDLAEPIDGGRHVDDGLSVA